MPWKPARRQVAALIGASAKEIVFTSGATESNNLAHQGRGAARCGSRGNHIVTLATEHKAVLDSCQHLEDEGFAVTYARRAATTASSISMRCATRSPTGRSSSR